MPQFDVDAAKKAGYSDDEILQHLTTSRKFDIDGALKAGYSKQDIIQHLAGAPVSQTPVSPETPVPEGFGRSLMKQISDPTATISGFAAGIAPVATQAFGWGHQIGASEFRTAAQDRAEKQRLANAHKDLMTAWNSGDKLGAAKIIQRELLGEGLNEPVSQIESQISSGDFSGALGTALGVAIPFYLGKGVAKGATSTGAILENHPLAKGMVSLLPGGGKALKALKISDLLGTGGATTGPGTFADPNFREFGPARASLADQAGIGPSAPESVEFSPTPGNLPSGRVPGRPGAPVSASPGLPPMPTPPAPQTAPETPGERFYPTPEAGSTAAEGARKANRTTWARQMARELYSRGIKPEDLPNQKPELLDSGATDSENSPWSQRSPETREALQKELEARWSRAKLKAGTPTKEPEVPKTTKAPAPVQAPAPKAKKAAPAPIPAPPSPPAAVGAAVGSTGEPISYTYGENPSMEFTKIGGKWHQRNIGDPEWLKVLASALPAALDEDLRNGELVRRTK